MTLDLRIPNEVEAAWEQGQAVVVSIVDEDEDDEFERNIRITVTRPLPEGKLWASYEEEIRVNVEGRWRAVWARGSLQPVSGETPEECLQNAIEVVASSARRTVAE